MLTAATRQAIDQVFADYDRPDAPGGALGVIRHGELIYARGYGMANLDHGIANTPQTAFNIGSEAKQFTGAALAVLVEEGALRLEDEIQRFVPAVPTFGQRITLDHLVHHTSGIPDYHERFTDSGLYENVWSQEELLRNALDYRQLDFAPGERFVYSNTGYLLLAVVVQQVAGTSFGSFVRERILQPLGMRHTLVHEDRRRIIPGRALAYRKATDGSWEMHVAWNETVPGDGKMWSTVEDLTLWDRNFYEPRIGRGRFGHLMRQCIRLNDGTMTRYGFGLDLGQMAPAECADYAVETHGGGHASFESVLVRLPGVHLSVILLCNTRDRRFRPAVLSMIRLILSDTK